MGKDVLSVKQHANREPIYMNDNMDTVIKKMYEENKEAYNIIMDIWRHRKQGAIKLLLLLDHINVRGDQIVLARDWIGSNLEFIKVLETQCKDIVSYLNTLDLKHRAYYP